MANRTFAVLVLVICTAMATFAAPASSDFEDKNKEKLETASSYGIGYGIYNGYSGLGYSPYATIGYPGYGYNLGYGQAAAYTGYGHHGYGVAQSYVPVYNDYSHGGGALGYYSGINHGYYPGAI